MRILPKILGACAIAALAGTAAWAAAKPVQHHLTVWLPGGGSEVVTYTGDVAPKVSFEPGAFDAAPTAFWSPFAIDTADMPISNMPINSIAAAMDSDMASMIREADAMMAMPMTAPGFSGMTDAGLRALPPDSQSYSVVSTVNGNNLCTRSVEITSAGNGHAPHVVRHASGNCSAVPPSASPSLGRSVLFQSLPSRHDGHLTTIGTTAGAPAPAYPHI